MIRTKHEIDTKLLNLFVSDKIFDDEINELLINWYSSLGNPNHQDTRDSAIAFLKKASDKVLTEIDYPFKQRAELIKIFEPLELLLRTALPLKSSTEKAHNVRDHLSHTIRNILFSNYLLKKFYPENYSSVQMQLIIAVIFHDLAYPIEKIKKVAHKLGTATLGNLLDSKGNIEIELNRPDDLLSMLDFFGNLISEKSNELSLIEKNPSGEDLLISKKELINKLKHIYREIISKAIAGVGLFDSSHSISSVVLFLLPIIKNSRDPKSYQDINLTVLADICLSMTYHDRGNLIQRITDFIIPLNLRIMRITDELQEWDRESNSYIKDVQIIYEATTILSMNMTMKHKSKTDQCDPKYFLPDKVRGLLPAIIGDEIIILKIEFPEEIKKTSLNSIFDNMNLHLQENEPRINYQLKGKKIGKEINMKFTNSNVSVLLN